MRKHTRFLWILSFLALNLLVNGQNNTEREIDEQIRIEIESLTLFNNYLSNNHKIHASSALQKFYVERNYQQVWVNAENIKKFILYLEHADAEGLFQVDYHYSAIKKKLTDLPGKIPEVGAAELDILLTDAFLTFTSHMLNGKVNPVNIHPQWNVIRREEDPVKLLSDCLKSRDFSAWWEKIQPDNITYAQLKEALLNYRQIEKSGGWPTIPQGNTLEKGTRDERVIILRRRLIISGDLPDKQFESNAVFDENLENAVMKFQLRHGLEADGRVGKASLAELNMTAGDRVKQLMVNLERWRWLPLNLGNYYLLVNIANFDLNIIQNNDATYSSNVIVGKPFRKTPVFSASMSHIVFNPTWTIPPTILSQDILPQVKKDPQYLAQRNMKVLDHQGREIDPHVIDWSATVGKGFPYIIRQEPGPNNALGDVKFMFPNPYHIYLHDTPNKELFAKSDRSFSSGCIRVSEPLKLAEFLLNDPQKYNQEKINKLIETRKTSTVFLKQNVAVYLLYWTSWVDRTGQIHFRKDIYERDEMVYKALIKSE